MTQAKIRNTGFRTREGGRIEVLEAKSPASIRGGAYGVGFGPLRLSPWEDTTARVDDLSFASSEPYDWVPLVSSVGIVGAVAHHERTDDEPIDPESMDLSRRGMLAAIGGSMAIVGTAAAQSQRYNVASFELVEAPWGINIAVDDLVADYLPPGHTFYVSVDGASVGQFDAGDESLTIGTGNTGTVRIESDDAISFVDEVLAVVSADDELRYRFSPVDDPFADRSPGEEITISAQPILVDPVASAGPSGTVVKIDDRTITHGEEGEAAAGEWHLRNDNELVYIVGEEAPDTTQVDVRVNVGLLDRLRAQYF